MSYDRVIVGMSGGVDSSVAALLLQQQGYAVSGLFMKNWEEDDSESYCAAEQDIKDATAVCEHLCIELETVNFAFEYWERVFEGFLSEYNAGRTPNPDILCNREIKFKEFLDHAVDKGAEYIATGHYARTRLKNGRRELLRGLDRDKDQSYFLHAISAEALNITLFPIGELQKSEVRHIAAQNDFINSDKRDSTGICFIGERKFREFLARYLKPNPGDIVDEHGRVVGEHSGLMYYTLGQRQGLGIGGSGDAWFVAAKNLGDNKLIAVQGHDHPLLYSSELTTKSHYFIDGNPPAAQFECTAKTRYRQDDFAVKVSILDSGDMKVHYGSNPQRAVTPGQSVVFYDGEVCLGGIPIDNTDSNPIY